MYIIAKNMEAYSSPSYLSSQTTDTPLWTNHLDDVAQFHSRDVATAFVEIMLTPKAATNYIVIHIPNQPLFIGATYAATKVR